MRVPQALIGANLVFGATVIAAEDSESVVFGNAKLDRLVDIGGTFQIENGELAFFGCTESCGFDGHPRERLVGTPYGSLGDDALVSMSALGAAVLPFLDQVVHLEPAAEEDSAARVVYVDEQHLIFDTVNTVRSSEDPSETSRVTTRWGFLVEPSGAFTARAPIEETPLYIHSRLADPVALYWRLEEPIHLYVKGVPEEYQDAVIAGVELWNDLSQSTAGIDVFDYELLNVGDPRYDAIVTGDYRYTVIEWDRTNRATYAGRAVPSVSPRTGEIINGASLLQGSSTNDLYIDWFAEIAGGESAASKRLPRESFNGAFEHPGCGFVDRRDTIFQNQPDDVGFETFMQSFWTYVTAHELGHVLGMPHNFKGSLTGGDAPSSSAMEYVQAQFRHLQALGAYDEAAFLYGHFGELPTDAPPTCESNTIRWNGSEIVGDPECNFRDAGPDPYAYLLNDELVLARDRLLGIENGGLLRQADFADLRERVFTTLTGVFGYATATDYARESFKQGERPTDDAEIVAYIFDDVRRVVCDPSAIAHLEAVYSDDRDRGVRLGRNWRGLVDASNTLSQFAANAPVGCGPPDLTFSLE